MVKRAKVERETPDVAKGVSRMIRAVGKRIGGDDPTDLREVRNLREALDEAEALAVEGLRARGFSWTEIGVGLGTTRQNAQQRYARKGIK